ncbi:MAG: hypothetical protein HKN87_12390 [Saprospiraceae bacterium]|nr:hypothetical protein [Saprospiraceae bacterium]
MTAAKGRSEKMKTMPKHPENRLESVSKLGRKRTMPKAINYLYLYEVSIRCHRANDYLLDLDNGLAFLTVYNYSSELSPERAIFDLATVRRALTSVPTGK